MGTSGIGGRHPYECQDCHDWPGGFGLSGNVYGVVMSGLMLMKKGFDTRHDAAAHVLLEEHTVLEIRDGSLVT